MLCEKPMTMTVEEAEDIAATVKRRGALFAVNYGYSGYAMVRHMRAMVRRGDLGRVRLVKAEFAHGFHADAADADNPRVRWRYDPAQAGPSAQFADCGIHALHMAGFICGQQPRELSADFVSTIASRTLEDDAMVNVRMDGGAVLRLWTSSVAIGRMHGLAIQVFGEKGGLRWGQEWPNQLYWTPLNGRTQILERGGPDLSPRPTAPRALRSATRRECRSPSPTSTPTSPSRSTRAKRGALQTRSPTITRPPRTVSARSPRSPPRSIPRGAQANGPTRVRLPCEVKRSELYGRYETRRILCQELIVSST